MNRRIKVIPLAQPNPSRNEWRGQVRNVRTDYLALFGRAPKNIAGIAVMTDTDNSRTACVSHFGDIYFSEEP